MEEIVERINLPELKTAGIMMLVAGGLWVCGFLFTFLIEGDAGVPVILFYLCIALGLLIASIAALLFLYRLTKFLITKDPRSLQ